MKWHSRLAIALFACAQSTKVFGRLWDNVIVKFEDDLAGWLAANVDIEEDLAAWGHGGWQSVVVGFGDVAVVQEEFGVKESPNVCVQSSKKQSQLCAWCEMKSQTNFSKVVEAVEAAPADREAWHAPRSCASGQ